MFVAQTMPHTISISLLALCIGSPLGSLFVAAGADDPKTQQPARPTRTEGRSPLGIAWGFIYGGDSKPYVFMPQLRALGASHTKLYLFWNQLEPEKGKYDWDTLDKFLDQLQSPDEALISIFSTSKWATRESALILPPSPAKNADDYYRMIHTVVSHCKGRIRYWQNDSEPNNPVFWAGTPGEFIAQL